MLVTLHGRHLTALSSVSGEPFIGRVRERATGGGEVGEQDIQLLRSSTEQMVPGSRACLVATESGVPPPEHGGRRDVFLLGQSMRHLAEGDVIRIDPRRGHINTLYRRASSFNALLLTERCDNFCVMCSQPPKTEDDAWRLRDAREAIPLMSRETPEIGITGGEPGLLGAELVDLVRHLEVHLPRTALHILSNGRAFAQAELARSLARALHHDLMVGIPLYSDLPEQHDYVVQARNGFEEAVRGILNLKQFGVRVEIRFVLHADTLDRAVDFARFLTRNLLFVDHVALMGLEPTGFAKTNIDALWVDPVDYASRLAEMVDILAVAGMRVSVYNHQLCTLDPSVRPFARQSISDWKNTFEPECGSCARKAACGGFFASATVRRSRGICAVS